MSTPATRTVSRLHRKHLSKGRATINDVFGGEYEVTSDGNYITTNSGEQYLNCAGYGVHLLGARNPHVVRRVREQLDKHTLSSRIIPDEISVHAAARLAESVPDEELSKVHFNVSGADATETALKLARANGVTRFITMINGYHGKTFGALSVTAKPLYQDPFRPLLEPVSEVPFGDIEALALELAKPGRACVIVEPVQGEAGVIIPPDTFLTQVSNLCRENAALLIVDEILTGLGRLGTYWASQVPDVKADMILVGKTLSGGVLPVAAVVARPDVYRPFDNDPFIHTSTFASAPISMAAVLGALEVIEKESVPERAREVGETLLPRLEGLRVEFPELLSDVRGRGCLFALEASTPGIAGELMMSLVEEHILVNHSLNHSAVLRLTPSAFCTEDEADRIHSAIRNGLAEIREETKE